MKPCHLDENHFADNASQCPNGLINEMGEGTSEVISCQYLDFKYCR
jgi:hypothetical protein